MARYPASRRNLLREKIRDAAESAAGALDPQDTERERQGQVYLDQLADDYDPAGEVFGAGTGRARRAVERISSEELQWDPARPYPQIQTKSTDPDRPRTVAAGYDPKNSILRVTFRNGQTYEYLGPTPRQWSTFQRVNSPGQYINRVLEQYPYRPLEE